MSRLFGDADDEMVGWVPDSGQRGTMDLLWTCIVTLFLCVWSSLHLNIPTEKSWRARARRRTIWLLFALIAPEMIVFNAYQQRKEAMYTANMVRKFQGYPPIQSPVMRVLDWLLCRSKKNGDDGLDEEIHPPGEQAHSTTRHPWTLVHGFYAAMGGFVIDTHTAGEPFLPHGKHQATLTTCGVRFVARRALHFLPDLRKEDIQDKSKADPLVKAIVCVQACWFCVQCLGRITSKLPLSLLELNTFAHALCTLMIYLLWWDKPLDIEQPSVIVEKDMHPLSALMAFMLGNIGCLWTRIVGRLEPVFLEVNASTVDHEEVQDLSTSTFRIREGSKHRGIQTIFSAVKYSKSDLPADEVANMHLVIDEKLDRYWGLVYRALALYPAPAKERWHVHYHAHVPVRPSSGFAEQVKRRSCHFEGEGRAALTHRCRNWMGDQFSTVESFWSLVVSISIAGFFYGALHALAWNAPFQSTPQALLWRISSLSLIALTPALFCLTLVIDEASTACRCLRGMFETVFFPIVVCLGGLYYVFIRVFVVVESFINLRHTSKGVYTSMPWSDYFPHVG